MYIEPRTEEVKEMKYFIIEWAWTLYAVVQSAEQVPFSSLKRVSSAESRGFSPGAPVGLLTGWVIDGLGYWRVGLLTGWVRINIVKKVISKLWRDKIVYNLWQYIDWDSLVFTCIWL
jgi:hypothetical protein